MHMAYYGLVYGMECVQMQAHCLHCIMELLTVNLQEFEFRIEIVCCCCCCYCCVFGSVMPCHDKLKIVCILKIEHENQCDFRKVAAYVYTQNATQTYKNAVPEENPK